MTIKMKRVINSGKMLTDEHINLAQVLLASQFPSIDGWQNCLYSQVDGFTPVKHEAIQIHHISGNHWVTSSSLGSEINVYDSKYHGKLDPSLTHQLALLYRPLADYADDDDYGEAAFLPHVQQQVGGVDCGLFAIAFAFHLALGDNLGKIVFDQSSIFLNVLKTYCHFHTGRFLFCRRLYVGP